MLVNPNAEDSVELALNGHAPDKPAFGAPCNGCGACCAFAPCPLSMLRYRIRKGKCPALEWDEASSVYRCGFLFGPKAVPKFLRPLMRRWIAAGKGCDFDAVLETP